MIDDNVINYLCKKSKLGTEELVNHLRRLEKVEEIANSSKYAGISHLKNMYYRKYLINPDDIPMKYLINNFGSGYIDIGIEDIITLQKSSLDMWLDYFLCRDVIYPEWFKFFVFQGIVKIGAYDEVKGRYNRRTRNTIAPFIDIDYEVIAFIYDNLCNFLSGNKLNDKELERIIRSCSFYKLYNYCEKKVELRTVKSEEDLIKIREIDAKLGSLEQKFKNLEEEKRFAEGDKVQKFRDFYYKVLNEIYILKDMRFSLTSLVKYNDTIELRRDPNDKNIYGIYLRNTNDCVGRISYRKFHISGYLGDIGYQIKEEFRGNGYAYQALELLSEKLYEDNIPNFLISVLENNIASKKTIEKYGGEINIKDGNVLVYLCETRPCKKKGYVK